MIRKAVVLVVALAALCLGLPMLDRQPTTSAGPGGPLITAGRVHASYQPKDGKIFVLIIGNDARSGNPDRSRADAIHIAGINTKTMKGGILNFPRDSWVNIPGAGTSKMNEALYRGGPGLLARTLENLTGIHIDYWVMTGFQGFVGALDRLGWVEYRIKRDIYDPTGSGAAIPAGTKMLGPRNSLAYVRTRHSFANGDIDRTTNQGRFLIALLRKLRNDVARSPAALLEWTSVARKYTRLDLGPDELFRLGVLTSQVKPKDVDLVTVPVSVGSVGAASVVFISPGAQSIYARFRKNASL